MGHTMSIHSQNDAVILEFGLHKPAYRICVNTPTTHGSIGLTTGLDPAMTLGCGGFGGNITSDNISPRHLINVKRVAYELRPATRTVPEVARVLEVPLPRAPEKSPPEAISNVVLTSRIDKFLASRGLAPQASVALQAAQTPSSTAQPEKFICEDDVRQAVKDGRKLLIGERTIITPAARDAGEAARIFVHAGWPSS
jgi:acetaldehyde dehydrogenase (acetylating)